MEPNQPQPDNNIENDPVSLAGKVVQIEKDCKTALQMIQEISRIVEENMNELTIIKPLLKKKLKEIVHENKE